MTVPYITALPTPPSRADDPQNFATKADAFLGALPGLRTEANTLGDYMETKAGEASASATAAAGSASTSTTQAGISTTQAEISTTQAGISTIKAGEALASANAAAASYDSFDDRYLGAKSSDPTTDNDGNALLVGALYFNSTSGVLKVWGGSSWIPLPASVAAGIVNAPAGTIAATNVQDAINELNGNLHGVVTKTLTNADVTLTAAEANNRMIFLSGALTANVTLYLPATVGEWMVNNGCTGAAFTVTVRVVGNVGGAHVVPNGYRKILTCYDGANVVQSVATILSPYFSGGMIVSDGNVYLSDNAAGTDVVNMGPILELGSNLGADKASRIDFHSEQGSDYNARLIRQAGANATFDIQQAGIGNINFVHGGTVHFAIAQNGAAFHRGPGWGNAGAGFFCRAWANINGTGTPAIKAAGNASSITDHGVGELSLNVTSALPDTNYAWNGTARSDSDGTSDRTSVYQRGTTFTKSTTALRVIVNRGSTSAVLIDSDDISISIFR